MQKRFYLSTRIDRAEQAAPLLKALQSKGWQRTYVWTAENVGPGTYADIAAAELADVVIVLLPGGFGTHVEIGAALALGKPLILHAPDRETLEKPYPCVFHYHPQVKLLVSKSLDVSEVVAHMEDAGGSTPIV